MRFDLHRVWIAAMSSSLMLLGAAPAARGEGGGLPDEVDRAALAELKAAVEHERKWNAEWPVEAALNKLTEGVRKARFVREGDAPCDACGSTLAGAAKRPGDVSEDEWRAMLATPTTADEIFGPSPEMTLVDLDGDGLRDLMAESYSGGSMHVSVVSVFRREADHFEWRGYWYATAISGVSQAQWLVRLDGRVFVVFRDGMYGLDSVYLLRPFYRHASVPRLRVRYRYLLEVPAIQPEGSSEGEGFRYERLDPVWHASLNAAVVANTPEAPMEHDATSAEPLCPLPSDPSHEVVKASYSGFGPGYYKDEPVADFGLPFKDECYIARLTDHHGEYAAEYGLFAYLQLRRPEAPPGRSFVVRGRRQVIGMETDLAPPISFFEPDGLFR